MSDQPTTLEGERTHNETPLVLEIRDKILEIVDEKRGAYWGEFYSSLVPTYGVDDVRTVLASLVGDGTLRMKEDDEEHDWEYIRCVKKDI